MKCPRILCLHYRSLSLPVRGAWIEIPIVLQMLLKLGSLPVRGAWIEILMDL